MAEQSSAGDRDVEEVGGQEVLHQQDDVEAVLGEVERTPTCTQRRARAEAHRCPGGREAARQFAELSSKEVEGVTGLHRTEDGWVVELDVLELRRVPETTDVLAIYEVTLDSSGGMEGYRRVHRYVRGQVEDA